MPGRKGARAILDRALPVLAEQNHARRPGDGLPEARTSRPVIPTDAVIDYH